MEAELGANEIDHDPEVLKGTESAGVSFGRLDQTIDGLGRPVGQACFQVGHDAIPMLADAGDHLLHFWQT